MLVLPRRTNESVIIGGHRRITVHGLRGDAVTLRFAERFGGRIGEVDAEVATLRRDGEHQPWPDVKVVAVDIRGDKVRLGITVPPGTAVHRKEAYDAIRREMGGADEA